MSNPRVSFAQLRRWLLDLGFEERLRPEGPVSFRHAASDTVLLLPRYAPEETVAPHHLAGVRVMLDGKGLLEGNDFDKWVAEATAKGAAPVGG
jgi:hypothetical protein